MEVSLLAAGVAGDDDMRKPVHEVDDLVPKEENLHTESVVVKEADDQATHVDTDELILEAETSNTDTEGEEDWEDEVAERQVEEIDDEELPKSLIQGGECSSCALSGIKY